jgi:hypothetical protein
LSYQSLHVRCDPATCLRSYEAVEDVLDVKDLYDPRTQWASYIVNALKVGSVQGGVVAQC